MILNNAPAKRELCLHDSTAGTNKGGDVTEYEERQAEKRARLLRAAEQARQESEAAYKRATSISEAIPMGQPILVGHHSEGRHRADLKRIQTLMRRAVELQERADELERRAENIGSGGISSDDPDAIAKLRAKLEELTARRELMKAVNRAHAKYLRDPQTDLSEFSEKIQGVIRDYKPEGGAGPHPFSGFPLTNLGARIRNTQKRIEQLQAQKKRQYQEIRVGDVIIKQNTEINRIQFIMNLGDFVPYAPNSEEAKAYRHALLDVLDLIEKEAS